MKIVAAKLVIVDYACFVDRSITLPTNPYMMKSTVTVELLAWLLSVCLSVTGV